MSVSHFEVTLDQQIPQNPAAEQTVLGAILINENCYERVSPPLVAEDFFRDAHRLIFAAIRRLKERNAPIDILTVKTELAQTSELDQAGGGAYISSLIDTVPNIANIEYYARLVKEVSTRRQMMVFGNETLKFAAETGSTSTEVIAQAEVRLSRIAESTIDRGLVPYSSLAPESLASLEARTGSRRLITGMPTAYSRFDEYTSGFQRQELIVIAARPSMGKSALMMNIAEALAIPGKDGAPRITEAERLYRIAIFSLEMSKLQLVQRTLSAESNVPGHLLRSGLLSERNWRDLADTSARLSKSTLWVDDTPAIDPTELRAKARRLSKELGSIDLVMVDYLQLMQINGKTESRQQEVSMISRSLKAIAKHLNVPLIALAQLSRRPEQRTGDHRPQLSDLRESGSIEQDADLVAFIYRDEVYHPDTEDKGIAEIIIAKQRNGPIGDFKLVFRNDITRFFNYEPQPDFMP